PPGGLPESRAAPLVGGARMAEERMSAGADFSKRSSRRARRAVCVERAVLAGGAQHPAGRFVGSRADECILSLQPVDLRALRVSAHARAPDWGERRRPVRLDSCDPAFPPLCWGRAVALHSRPRL